MHKSYTRLSMKMKDPELIGWTLSYEMKYVRIGADQSQFQQ